MARLAVMSNGHYMTDTGRMEGNYDLIVIHPTNIDEITFETVHKLANTFCALYVQQPTIDFVVRIARKGVFGPPAEEAGGNLVMNRPRIVDGPNLIGFLAPELYKRVVVRFENSRFTAAEFESSYAAFYKPQTRVAIWQTMLTAGIQWGIFTIPSRSTFKAKDWVVRSLEDDILDKRAVQHGED